MRDLIAGVSRCPSHEKRAAEIGKLKSKRYTSHMEDRRQQSGAIHYVDDGHANESENRKGYEDKDPKIQTRSSSD